MIQRQVAILLCFGAFVLAACSGAPADTSVPALPGASAYDKEKNKNVDALVTNFDTSVRELLREQGYSLPERPKIFSTTLDVPTVTSFYEHELPKKGWRLVPGELPNTPTRVMLAYQKSNALFIITVLDTKSYLGEEVVVYTLKATK